MRYFQSQSYLPLRYLINNKKRNCNSVVQKHGRHRLNQANKTSYGINEHQMSPM